MVKDLKITDLKDDYQPKSAMIIYNSGNNYYLETHRLYKKGDEYKMGSGQPISENAMINIVKSMVRKRQSNYNRNQLFNENLLFVNYEIGEFKVVWYIPSGIRNLMFAKELKLTDCKMQLPGIILKWNGTSLELICFKGNKRPDKKTLLYKAPFYNTTGIGAFCLGTARVNKSVQNINDLMANVESAFFNSLFTDVGDTRTKGDKKKVWIEACEKKRFLLSELVLSPVKLEAFIFNGRNTQW